MNKIAKMMCLVAVLALVGTSCKKKDETTTIKATFAEFNVADEDGAKSYLVGTKLEWDATDQFEVFNVWAGNNEFQSDEFYVLGAGGATVQLAPVNGTIEETTNQGAFYAFYPAGVPETGGFQRAFALGNGHVTGEFLLPPVQYYRKVGGRVAVPQYSLAAAAKETQTQNLQNVNFDMHAINGVLHLRYWTRTGKKVDHIVVRDKRFCIAGLVQVYLDKINTTELTEKFAAYDEDNTSFVAQLYNYKKEIGYYIPEPAANPYLSQEVTLQCKYGTGEYKDGVALGTSENSPTSFYIGLRPMAAYRGMRIIVYYTDGTHFEVYNNNTDNRITPSMIRNMRVREVSVDPQ